jgi:hypothetical protein
MEADAVLCRRCYYFRMLESWHQALRALGGTLTGENFSTDISLGFDIVRVSLPELPALHEAGCAVNDERPRACDCAPQS